MLKTFLLGVDGLPCWMWRQFAASGVMPRSAALLKSGELHAMQSAIPEVSSSAWASIVTGKNPGSHNVYGFTDLMDGAYSLGFTSSRTFKAPPFWQFNDGTRNLIINVPQSYPAQPLNGTLISGFVALDLKRAVYPPEQLSMLEELGYRVDADMSTIEVSKDHFLRDLHEVLSARYAALDHLWSSEAWDTIMFVITGTDRINHYLWEDYEDPHSPWHQKFLDFYHEVDKVIGHILDRLPDETTLVAVSDHGFGRQSISVNINCLLHERGWLSLRKTDRPSYVDMLPESRAFAMDPGRLYLHRKGRYPNGRIDVEQMEDHLCQLEELFLGMEINGMKLVDRCLRGTDVYQGPFAHRAPDLVLMAAEGVALSGRMNVTELIEQTRINGKHTFENSSFFYRGIQPVSIPSTMRVEDVLGIIQQANCMQRAA